MSERMEMCDLCEGSGLVRVSTNKSAPACVTAIRDHLGGKPELVGEVVATLRDLWWDGIEGACDECGGDDADCPPNCVIRRARAILSRIEPKEQNDG